MEDLHMLKKSENSKFSKPNTSTKWSDIVKKKTGHSEQINRNQRRWTTNLGKPKFQHSNKQPINCKPSSWQNLMYILLPMKRVDFIVRPVMKLQSFNHEWETVHDKGAWSNM